jgi:hypothetical protein
MRTIRVSIETTKTTAASPKGIIQVFFCNGLNTAMGKGVIFPTKAEAVEYAISKLRTSSNLFSSKVCLDTVDSKGWTSQETLAEFVKNSSGKVCKLVPVK